MKKSKLSDIPGEKIRRQYFNIPIYLLLTLAVSLDLAVTAAAIQNGTFGSEAWLGVVLVLTVPAAAVVPVLLVLSVLNRFCFGKVICVLDEKGLYYQADEVRFIWWNDIKRVEYEPDLPGVRRPYCSYNVAAILSKPFQKEIVTELDGAPHFLLRRMKAYHPDAEYRFTKLGMVFVFLMTLGTAMAAMLISLI